MRISNTTAREIILNFRTGATQSVPAGGYIIRPDSEFTYLDDNAVTLALFSGGSLQLLADNGGAWGGSALPSAPNPQKLPYLAGVLIDQNNQLKRSDDLTTVQSGAVSTPSPYLPGAGRLRDYLPKTAAMFKRVRAGGRGLILINGDSTVNGFGTTLATTNSSRRNLPAVMARSLRQFGIHAHFNGFCGDQAVGTANVTTNIPNLVLGADVTTSFGGSIGANFFKINGAGALSWTGTEPFDTVYVDYLTTNASGGDLEVDIGGSSLATLASLQATGVYTSGPIALGSLAVHTVNVKRAAGATIQGNVFAIRCYNSANPGVLLMTVGGGGKKTSDLIQTGNYGYANTYAMMAPDLVICGEQINDWDNDVTVATHAANIATMITQSKNAGNSDVILLDGPRSRSSIATLEVQDAYHASDIATAAAQGVPMASLWDVFGPNDNTAAQNLIYLDAVGHLTEAGYGDYGYLLASMIGREFAA